MASQQTTEHITHRQVLKAQVYEGSKQEAQTEVYEWILDNLLKIAIEEILNTSKVFDNPTLTSQEDLCNQFINEKQPPQTQLKILGLDMNTNLNELLSLNSIVLFKEEGVSKFYLNPYAIPGELDLLIHTSENLALPSISGLIDLKDAAKYIREHDDIKAVLRIINSLAD